MPHQQAASTPAPAGLGENKGIKFKITTGGKTWACTLQDRAQYERTKSAKADKEESEGQPAESGESTTTTSSSSSTKSS
ncbi:hypothetical protein ESCO_003179 [Escovopsis weberi]|uniref:Uncharacterized protein n=1 Tax=Escovopsis weberi TaxID=150374 RepID=A0A0M8N1I3_ESCWE|nr:hypothetical protein ESCO_003179 [Escovopsis weberi]